MSRILIFANGDLPHLEKARALLRDGDFIIAADGGIRHVFALGLTPGVLIGDLDSLPAGFDAADFDGEIVLFPKDKNETDLELAIQHALTLAPDSIIILGALGGRVDQTLANLALLSNELLSAFDVRLNDGVEEIFFCREQVQIEGRSGDIVSLIPWRGEVTDVVTSGLKWTLHNEILYPDKTRGISNEMTGDAATVSIKSGLLLVIHRNHKLPGV
jgi:thiamine pyrophosphokinase